MSGAMIGMQVILPLQKQIHMALLRGPSTYYEVVVSIQMQVLVEYLIDTRIPPMVFLLM